MARGEGDGLRRRRGGREDHAISGDAQRFGHDLGEFARQEAAVVADSERVTVDACRRVERSRRHRYRVSHAADVVEGEAVRDDGAPAVSAERDHVRII